jgi:hypothetical protein
VSKSLDVELIGSCGDGLFDTKQLRAKQEHELLTLLTRPLRPKIPEEVLERGRQLQMAKDIDDFGFSFSDGSDIPEVTSVVKSTNDLTDRYGITLKMINTFLDNLAKEPDKKYLLWPDRAAKVKAFKDKLNAI